MNGYDILSIGSGLLVGIFLLWLIKLLGFKLYSLSYRWIIEGRAIDSDGPMEEVFSCRWYPLALLAYKMICATPEHKIITMHNEKV